MSRRSAIFISSWILACVALLGQSVVAGQAATYSVGVAQVDVTPDYPIRLSGFGFRRAESEGVAHPIFARAMVIAEDSNAAPVVLVTVDNLGIPAAMCDEVARRLQAKIGLPRPRLVIAASHTHSAPMLRGVAGTLFGQPIPDDQWQRIDRYTAELTDKIEQVALAAWNDRQPSKIFWGVGSVKFAFNRRTKEGPVDHDLPLLVVKNLEGKLRAVYVNYACHCVTLLDNKISADWVGCAADAIQREFPTATAMISIGCGADQNPSLGSTKDRTEAAMGQGEQIATEVKRMLRGFMAPIEGPIKAVREPIALKFADPPTRAEWEEKAKKTDAVGYHAQMQLQRLDRGEALQATLDYPVVSWTFGDALAMVFLPGEVVVDYSLRLKRDLDGQRLIVTAYANDAPCYIPSERVLKEGGYEAAGAMVYYDRPGPLKAGLEDQITNAVHRQLDGPFSPRFDWKKTQQTLPRSPQQSLAMLETTPNLRVDLVVAEPLIRDPVAIDFGLDGALWVAEMHDYPVARCIDVNTNNGQADQFVLGQIRLVRDSDNDGQFDSSTVFLDGIPYPTGVMAWRKGVLICSAPDILYAEDTDGNDKADFVKKVLTGFGTANIQARVNSLFPGLDGWVYGSCGLFGGKITNFKGQEFELGNRDFRFKPPTGEFEPVTGRTQQGRVRDDFGNWFGCDNTNMGFFYPLEERYLRRNPWIVPPTSRIDLIQSDDERNLFPARTDAQRFQLSGAPGSVTAACGIGVYREQRLGAEYQGNLFTCEPVNLLVHRMVLEPNGSSFVAKRAPNEKATELLRSSDGWFRPVQAITGPDGNLWIVDMYRFLIEDPRWIPEHELAPLDVRAGSALGRIYRVMRTDDQTPAAVRYRGGEGGTERDNVEASIIHRELELQQIALRTKQLGRESFAIGDVPKSLLSSADPVRRMFHYRRLSAMEQVEIDDVVNALKDPNAGVRKYGLLLAEQHLQNSPLPQCVMDAARDPDAHVRLQAACTLGYWDVSETGPVLAELVLNEANDPYLVAAVFSSLSATNFRAFSTSLYVRLNGEQLPSTLVTPLLATATGFNDETAIRRALENLAVRNDNELKPWHLQAILDLVAARAQQNKTGVSDPDVSKMIRNTQEKARTVAVSDSFDDGLRLTAIELLGRDPLRVKRDIQLLVQLLSAVNSPIVQVGAVEGLERIGDDNVPDLLADHFRAMSPAAQARAIDAFLSRDAWLNELLTQISGEVIPASALTAAQRQEILGHPEPTVRERAAQLLAVTLGADRKAVVAQYHAALELAGDSGRGRGLFAKNCSQCHKVGETGHAIGPDLAMVANKSPGFLLQEILDPNRNVDSRYTTYTAVLKEGLTRTGILANESAGSVTLRAAEAKQFTLQRQELDELRANGKSLMPEGLEKDLNPQNVADVIAYLGTLGAGNAAILAGADAANDQEVREVAAKILDDKLGDEAREAMIAKYPVKATELVLAMARDLPIDATEEYRRIPWIWRVAVACGKRNQPDQIRPMLNATLPEKDQPLRDWQAVVIGGGLINGIGLSGGWPRARLNGTIGENAALKSRWQRCMELASAMADDEKVPTGTRYDAMRIVALDGENGRRDQLAKYLAKGVHDELQMGAISGLSDIESDEVAPLLLKGIDHFNDENRGLAIGALLRTEGRTVHLLDAIAAGSVPNSVLSAEQKKALRESKSAAIKDRAVKVLGD